MLGRRFHSGGRLDAAAIFQHENMWNRPRRQERGEKPLPMAAYPGLLAVGVFVFLGYASHLGILSFQTDGKGLAAAVPMTSVHRA